MTRTDAAGRVTLTLHGAATDLVVDLVGYSAVPVPNDQVASASQGPPA